MTADVDVTAEIGNVRQFVTAMQAAGFELRVTDVDGFVAKTRARARTVDVGGVDVPVISPEDLVVTKILAARPKDGEDTRNVLLAQPSLDLGYVRATLTMLEEALGRMQVFRRLHACTALLLVACGRPGPVITLQVKEESFTAAACPSLPTDITVLAQLVVNADSAQACPLTFSLVQDSGAYTVNGSCPNIAAGSVIQLALQWYTLSPNLKKFILLAESDGTLDLTKPSRAAYTAVFNTPKTQGLATDSLAVQNEYNCKRTGVYTCDSSAAAANVTTDESTCSNLEELCQDTLFNPAMTNDQCP